MTLINLKSGYRTILLYSFLLLICSCASLEVKDYELNLTKDAIKNKMIPAANNDKPETTTINFTREYDASVHENNYSKLLYGNNETAVILLHGFISSPFEVYFLGREINKLGFTVYLPLIDGFGGSTELANKTGYRSWQSTINKSIALLSPHYSNIILVGFSLGGTLVSDFILNEEPISPALKGAVLLAPYFSPKVIGGTFFNNLADVFTDSISLKTLHRFSANADLKIPISNPLYYNTDMPLKAVREIIEYGEILRDQKKSTKTNLPLLFVYTEDDQTVDNKVSVDFIETRFNNVQTIKFPKKKKVKHQFAVPVGNKEFDFFCSRVIHFIENLSPKQ